MSNVFELSSLCNRGSMPVVNQPQMAYVLTKLQPDPVLSEKQAPLNLVLILDRSSPETLRVIKTVTGRLIDQLQSQDVISVILLGGSKPTIYPAQTAADLSGLMSQLKRMRSARKRSLAAGLAEALQQASRKHSPERASRILLILGGQVEDNLNACRAVASQAGEKGIPIIGLGVGADWQEEFLIDLADRSVLAQPGSCRGDVYGILPGDNAGQICQQIYRSMQIVARGCQIVIRPATGVHIGQVWQMTPAMRIVRHAPVEPGAAQSQEMTIAVGDVGIEGVSYLAETILSPRQAGNVRIMQTSVTCQAPGFGEQHKRVDLIVEFSSTLAVTNPLDGDVMDVVQRALAFKAQNQALEEAETHKIPAAVYKLRNVIPILISLGENQIAGQLRQEISNLERDGCISDEGRKVIRLALRRSI